MLININDVHIKKLSDKATIPTQKYLGDAGYDLYSAQDVVIKARDTALVLTDIAIALPFGLEAQIRSRSGLALKNKIAVLNSPGTIDYGYRNNIGIILINHSDVDYNVNVGDRIAQLVINKIEQSNFIEVDTLSEAERGLNGFGSTGI